ncbi:hypothetical protein [Pediococcus pentosaceus]|uniref:hypothetical protein n=1 Tax=Pediococcus pentosaceus TaxID=1255 RepID=UPI001F571018|nr:hypothetical protein [Pediococcus pentosaceus]MCI2961029.1 hypothetical protein [Pediococcus pentosaceus]
MDIVKEESTSIDMKMTKYGWCSPTEIKIFGELDRQIKQKKKDDSKQDRPFIMPKKERETIKIDWRRGDM